MKKTALRFVAFLLVTAFTCGFICSCSDKYYKEVEQTDEEKRIVMTVGDYDVTYDFFRAVFLAYTDKESIVTTDNFDSAMNTVINFFAYFYSVFEMCSDEGISVKSNKLMNRVDEVIVASIDGGTAEGVKYDAIGSFEKYKEALAKRNMNDFVNRKMILQSLLENDLSEKYTDLSADVTDETLSNYFNSDEYIRITWLMTEYKDIAESVYDSITNGYDESSSMTREDFIIRKFIQNTVSVSSQSIKDGWYIGKYETGFVLDNIFESAAGIRAGEFTEIIEGNDGYYYIVYRLEKEPSFLENSKNEVKKSYLNSEFYKKLKTYENSLKENISYKELYYQLRNDPSLL